jgi:DNA-binding transcriptional MerR regulator
MDMTLEAIRQLLSLRNVPEQNCEAVDVLLEQHIHHAFQRTAQLIALEKELKALRDHCASVHTTKYCGICRACWRRMRHSLPVYVHIIGAATSSFLPAPQEAGAIVNTSQ